MQKTITVTKEDIVHGKKNKSTKCPIALALKRNFPDAVDINVGYSLYVELPECETLTCEAPKTATKFMADFDAGDKVKPFKFTADFALR